jgi:putative GTP pyrophosphokinase
MPPNTPPISSSRVDAIGRRLRVWWIDDRKPLKPGDGRVVYEYRSSFQDPLKKVTVGLRQFVERESNEIIVGQRLKRMPQILNKLQRFPSMRLSQMEDIAGCRAILQGAHAEVTGVLRRVRRNWEVVYERDYVADPKSTGYRGRHVVVRRDGHLIEIQLRTPGQHEWAEAVERAAARTGYHLKDGSGPPELLTYFELAAWAIDMEEDGQIVDIGFQHAFENLRERVRPYLAPLG